MKGQIGLETIFAVAAMIILFIFSFILYANRNSDVSFVNTFLEAERICRTTENTINQVASDGHGTSAQINIPSKLEGEDYNITIDSYNRRIFVKSGKNLFSCPIIIQNVTNSTHRLFDVKKGLNLISNSDEIVIIQKI